MEFSHLGSYSGTYKFDSSVEQRYKNMFLQAVALWSNTTMASMSEDSNAIGTIVQGNYGAQFVAAAILIPGNSTNGHAESWMMYINTYYSDIMTVSIIAHELGHIWGLTDLENENNVNKLMYYSTDCTATVPTSSDIKGFNVITGIHNTHNWEYTNIRRKCRACDGIKTESHLYVWTDYNASTHRGECSTCGQIVYEDHNNYYSNLSGCSRCGRKAPIQVINSVFPLPEEMASTIIK